MIISIKNIKEKDISAKPEQCDSYFDMPQLELKLDKNCGLNLFERKIIEFSLNKINNYICNKQKK